jgi:hypothetical protein
MCGQKPLQRAANSPAGHNGPEAKLSAFAVLLGEARGSPGAGGAASAQDAALRRALWQHKLYAPRHLSIHNAQSGQSMSMAGHGRDGMTKWRNG